MFMSSRVGVFLSRPLLYFLRVGTPHNQHRQVFNFCVANVRGMATIQHEHRLGWVMVRGGCGASTAPKIELRADQYGDAECSMDRWPWPRM